MFKILIFFAFSMFFTLVHAEINEESALESELDLSSSEVSIQDQQEQHVKAKSFYISGIAGIGAYPEVSNIDKGYNVSGFIGYYFNNLIELEAGVGAGQSQMTVKNLLFADKRDTFQLNQYQGLMAAKYPLDIFASQRLMPKLGAVLSYTFRKYYLTNGATLNTGNTGGSEAIDAGWSLGADYKITESYAVGMDFKFMYNLSSKVSSNYINPTYGYNGVQLEKLQYYIAGLSARMSF